MKLQLDEIVEHPDVDLILRTLERSLREVSLETIRDKDQLTVYGLGPSFRTMNRNDKTIVQATSQPTATALHIDATFLASALAGDIAQEDIVRSKIERAVASLKTELNCGGISSVISSVPVSEMPQADAPVSTAAAGTVAPIIAEITLPAPVDTKPDPLPTVELRPSIPARTATEASIEPQPELHPKPELRKDEPVLIAADRSVPAPPSGKEEVADKKRRSAMLLLLPVLVVLLIAAGYFVQRRAASQSLSAAKPEVQATAPSAPVAKESPAPSALAESAQPAQPAPAEMPSDIKAWVELWAAAMGTSNIESQLSFYETPLNRYFLNAGVSKEQLLKDKQSEIDNRKGPLTFKAEKVVVEKQTPTNAVVTLIKHITVQLPSSTIEEQHIKTQLKLKLVDGGWKIISERTIG